MLWKVPQTQIALLSLNKMEVHIKVCVRFCKFYVTIDIGSLNFCHGFCFRFSFYGFNDAVCFNDFYLVLHHLPILYVLESLYDVEYMILIVFALLKEPFLIVPYVVN